jgi:hypothetical protein
MSHVRFLSSAAVLPVLDTAAQGLLRALPHFPAYIIRLIPIWLIGTACSLAVDVFVQNQLTPARPASDFAFSIAWVPASTLFVFALLPMAIGVSNTLRFDRNQPALGPIFAICLAMAIYEGCLGMAGIVVKESIAVSLIDFDPSERKDDVRVGLLYLGVDGLFGMLAAMCTAVAYGMLVSVFTVGRIDLERLASLFGRYGGRLVMIYVLAEFVHFMVRSTLNYGALQLGAYDLKPHDLTLWRETIGWDFLYWAASLPAYLLQSWAWLAIFGEAQRRILAAEVIDPLPPSASA